MHDDYSDMERRAARWCAVDGPEAKILATGVISEDVPTLIADVRRYRAERDEAREACRLANDAFRTAIGYGTNPEARRHSGDNIDRARAAVFAVLYPPGPVLAVGAGGEG